MNAVLYILNDYNIKVREGAPRGIQTYMKAYNAKIIPIFLTIASTLLGFIPFLIGDINPFWKSLAIGTMSGLTFSLPVLIIYLPMTFRFARSESQVNRLQVTGQEKVVVCAAKFKI